MQFCIYVIFHSNYTNANVCNKYFWMHNEHVIRFFVNAPTRLSKSIYVRVCDEWIYGRLCLLCSVKTKSMNTNCWKKICYMLIVNQSFDMTRSHYYYYYYSCAYDATLMKYTRKYKFSILFQLLKLYGFISIKSKYQTRHTSIHMANKTKLKGNLISSPHEQILPNFSWMTSLLAAADNVYVNWIRCSTCDRPIDRPTRTVWNVEFILANIYFNFLRLFFLIVITTMTNTLL